MNDPAILFVDDEKNILTSLRRAFFDEPFNSLFADSGPEALKMITETPVQVIVTDMRMPEMSGLELLKIVKTKYPSIVRLILSGYTEQDTLLEAINDIGVFRFVTKPWKLEELKLVINEALKYYDADNGAIG